MRSSNSTGGAHFGNILTLRPKIDVNQTVATRCVKRVLCTNNLTADSAELLFVATLSKATSTLSGGEILRAKDMIKIRTLRILEYALLGSFIKP